MISLSSGLSKINACIECFYCFHLKLIPENLVQSICLCLVYYAFIIAWGNFFLYIILGTSHFTHVICLILRFINLLVGFTCPADLHKTCPFYASFTCVIFFTHVNPPHFTSPKPTGLFYVSCS